MIDRITAAILVGVFTTTPVFAQTPAPSADKPETSCNTAPGTTTGKAADSSSTNSMAMEKSAILPSASGHANSAAPTVQSDGKPMQVSPDCPPDAKSK